MADAEKAGGLYYTADGTAVDANGEAVKGAPKRKPDTDPSKQPGAMGAPTPEERMGREIAAAIRGEPSPSAVARVANDAATAATDDDEDEGTDSEDSDELPTLADMPAHLETIDDLDELKALKKQDTRKGGKELIQARIDAIKEAGE